MPEHLPDPFHRGKVPVQFALEALPVRAIVFGEVISSGPHTQRSAVGVSTRGHGIDLADHALMSTVTPACRSFPLLPNAGSETNRAIRLIVHGRSGGVIPESLMSLCESLQKRRSAPVDLEVLTADGSPLTTDQTTWLVPLLLWPGAHARSDVPMIRSRLRSQGQNVQLLPFLGAWDSWWFLVAEALQPFAASQTVLVHHPLRPGLADRFLDQLAKRLQRPLISYDQWPEYRRRYPDAQPLTLALSPNRMTESLGEVDGWPPLLNQPMIRQGLIELLASLP